jgi:outer membrane protein assembly factor BamB
MQKTNYARINIKKSIAFLMLVLMTTSILMQLPFVFGKTYTVMPDRPTGTEVGISPTLIGLTQSVLINVIVYPGPSGPTYEGQTLVPSLNSGYANVSVTIKHPDGKQETFKPIDSTLENLGIVEPGRTQIVGHLMFTYKPATTGNYSVTGSFPGQIYTSDYSYPNMNLSVYYKPSMSTKPTTFTVQEEPVNAGILNGWPYVPLPQNYWENPVQTDNRDWAPISGDWPQRSYDILGSNYNPYTTAPKSPHIIWTKQVLDGGLIGGIWGSLPYPQDTSASGSAPAPVVGAVLDGKIYRTSRSGYFECVDLRTGVRLWEAAGSLWSAQRLDLPYQTATQVSEGAISKWLWGGITQSTNGAGTDKWYRYNTNNGDLLQTITNVPKDLTSVKFEDGDPIAWCMQASLATWNTTQPLKLPYVNLIKWNYSKLVSTVGYSQVYSSDWTKGIEWNVTTRINDQVDVGDNYFRGPTCMPFRDANVVIVRTPNAMQIMTGFDYTTGKFLWKNNATVLNIDVLLEGIATSPSGPTFARDSATPNNVAYDVKTGQEIFRVSTGEVPWGFIPAYSHIYHNGVNFMGSYDGFIYAYDSSNGQKVWQSPYIGTEFETVENNQPFNGHAIGADGVLYFSSVTTYQMMPRPRFALMVALNESTGEYLWKLPIDVMPIAVADGYLVGESIDNGILYGIGKGQTETTIAASPAILNKGNAIMIEGTVTDQSPGKPGTPAVSDTDMSEWMDFLYGQNATLLNNPPSPTGVPVTLTVVDSNGNDRQIGTTTTNSKGLFHFQWTPDIIGEYVITASFAGSESYWSSSSQTAIGVTEAETTPTQQIQQLSVVDMYFVPAIVGIIVAVIVVGAVLALLMLRKRP